MGVVELFLIAVGLSMDAFAVSVCKGLSMKRIIWSQTVVIALFFGVFQALMPLLGYFLGTTFSAFVEPIDHWITFILLAAIGVKMIWDGVHDEAEAEADETSNQLRIGELVMLAVATSIDAFAVGCSFAFNSVNIWEAISIIGITTFVLSLIGVMLGHGFGTRYNRPATIFGGVVLILIGLKTLLEHLGLLVISLV